MNLAKFLRKLFLQKNTDCLSPYGSEQKIGCLTGFSNMPLTAWKVSKYGVYSGPYFPAFGLNTERYFVFSPNAGKYGPEKTPYLDTFSCSVCTLLLSLLGSQMLTRQVRISTQILLNTFTLSRLQEFTRYTINTFITWQKIWLLLFIFYWFSTIIRLIFLCILFRRQCSLHGSFI